MFNILNLCCGFQHLKVFEQLLCLGHCCSDRCNCFLLRTELFQNGLHLRTDQNQIIKLTNAFKINIL